MDKDTIIKPLLALANEVRSTDQSAAARLEMMADTVDTGTYVGALAELDLFEMINIDLIVDEYRNQQQSGGFIKGLEVARDVLIFAPIIVTWTGIAFATSAYQALLSQCLQNCPDQVSQPFLYLWQQGFAGRLFAPDLLRISSIGFIDASILLFILLSTLIITTQLDRRNRQQEAKAQELHAKLTHALMRTSVYLRDLSAPLISPHDNLDDAAKQVDAMAQSVLARFDQLGKTLIGQFDTVTAQMQTEFSSVTQQFKGVAQQLSQQVTVIEKEFGRQLAESNKHLDTLGSLVGGVNQLATDIKGAATILQSTNGELRQSLNALNGPVTQLAKQQQTLLQAAQQSVGNLGDIVKKLGELDAQQKKWANQFIDTMEAMDVSIGKIDGLVSGIGDSNKQQKAFLEILEKERIEQSKLTQRMTDAAASIKSVLDGLDAGAINMRSMAFDVRKVLELQAGITNANQMDVTGIVNGYTRAARMIEKSGSDLSDAAVGIFKAARELQNAIDDLKTKIAP